jgi:N12 class adenine-specific DNA methylase
MEVLGERIRRIAEAGRLRVPQDRATALVHAAGSGTTLTLIATPADRRDPGLSELAREAVIAAITADAPAAAASGPVAAAVALRARLPEVETLSPAEQALLADWLDRIARESSDAAPR